MLTQLMREGRYEEALKLLENRQDSQALLWRMQCYEKLQRDDLIITWGDRNLSQVDDFYYNLFPIFLEALIRQEKLLEAYNLLSNELKIPYIPAQFETYLQQQYKLVNQALNAKKTKPDLVSAEDMHNRLTHFKGTSDEWILLKPLADQNIRLYLDPIRKILANRHINRISKTLFIELLSKQQVDELFTLETDEGLIEINPVEIDPFWPSEHVETIINSLRTYLKNPVLTELAEEILWFYAASVYPIEIMEDEIQPVACALHWHVSVLHQIKVDPLSLCQSYDTRLDLVQYYLEQLQKIAFI